MKKKIKCADADLVKAPKECDYVRPAIKKIELKKGPDGTLQVRLNGEGAWYPAWLEGNKLTFYA